MSQQRSIVAIVVVVADAVVADALLLLSPAGEVLAAVEVFLLVVLALVAVVAVAVAPRPVMWVLPVAALLVFRFGVGPAVGVPGDAVLRDAQAGLAVAVVVLAQFAVVAIGMAVGRSRAVSG